MAPTSDMGFASSEQSHYEPEDECETAKQLERLQQELELLRSIDQDLKKELDSTQQF